MRTRSCRILFLLLVFAFLTTIVAPGPRLPESGAGHATLFVAAVALDPEHPARRRLGPLVFRRGWVLKSDDHRFGGISAMQVVNGRIIAISDNGTAFQFAIPQRAGRQIVSIEPLPHRPGISKRWRDTESLVVHQDRAWVGYERRNSVRRFRLPGWREDGEARPILMRRWPPNAGAEAMVRFADGRFLVFDEGSPRDEFSPVILFDGDPSQPATRATALRYRRIGDFRVTDAAQLPDGRLLIVNREADWLGNAAAILVVAQLPRTGNEISYRPIAELRAPLTVDNMEALSIARERGETIVRIASDDNFWPLQRTLLLEFALAESPRGR